MKQWKELYWGVPVPGWSTSVQGVWSDGTVYYGIFFGDPTWCYVIMCGRASYPSEDPSTYMIGYALEAIGVNLGTYCILKQFSRGVIDPECARAHPESYFVAAAL